MRKTRWAWYLLLTLLGTACTEGQAWSTPVVLADPVVLLLYGVHYLLILDYLARRQALTLRALAAGGLVIGFATESLLTKVIWNPAWQTGEGGRLLGLHLYGVGFVVGVWHTWLSMALPLALTLTCFGQSQVLSERATRRLLLAMPLTQWFSASLQSPGLIPLALAGIPLNALGIAAAAWLYQRQARRAPLLVPADMALTRRERRVGWVVLLGLYALLMPVNAEALPGPGPFVLGLALVGGSIWLLTAVARADRGRMAPPINAEAVAYTPRRFARYTCYYAVVGALLIAAGALTQPFSTLTLVVGLVPLSLAGDGYLVRLAWRVRPHRRPMPA
ncbi:MAG: hypothetical protein ACUVSU_15210 [Aggregatilineaceae bacterium]